VRVLLAAILLFVCTIPASFVQAQVPGVEPESKYTLNGYVKYLVRAVLPQTGSNGYDHLIHQRFNFEYRWSDTFSLTAGMRNRLLWGDSLDLPFFDKLVTADPGYLDFSWNWLDEDNVIGNTTLDRLYFDWHPGDWQSRFGRQRINWGMATLWNPNDLFNVYSIYDFDYEERPGTDALLINRNLGFASSAEIIWGLGEDWDDTSLAGRYLFNTKGYDIQIIGGKQKIDLVIGAGFAGSLGGAGLHGEVSYFHPYKDEWQGIDQNPSTVATIETDYSFTGRSNLVLRGSILYISNPEDPGNALIYLNQPLTAKTMSFTRWTGYGELAFDITSLSRQTFGAAVYDDGSWYFTATNGYSLADNWQLLLVWQHFDGSSDSLFGENPTDMIYGRIRWSF
jgi:hypothetical protein